MRTLILTLLLMCSLQTAVFAEGLVMGPRSCRLTWGQPSSNTDSSPLTNLGTYNVYLQQSPGTDWSRVVGVLPPSVSIMAPAPIPDPQVEVSWLCGGLKNGQYYAVITAVNTTGNEGAWSNEVPFVFSGVAPLTVPNARANPR